MLGAGVSESERPGRTVSTRAGQVYLNQPERPVQDHRQRNDCIGVELQQAESRLIKASAYSSYPLTILCVAFSDKLISLLDHVLMHVHIYRRQCSLTSDIVKSAS